MAPSKDTTTSNDTASVPVLPTKSFKALNGTNGAADTNGTNGVSHETITSQTVLNVEFDSIKKTDLKAEIITRKFDCVKHVRPAEFPEALGALPFPTELGGLVAWTDAFVERLGWMALQIQEKSAHKDVTITRADKRNEDLNRRIQELQTKLHGFVDENHKLRGKVAQLTSRNKFLEGQHKREHEQIEGFEKDIAQQKTEIVTLTQENEKLRVSVKSLVAEVERLIDQHKGDEESRRALIEGFKKWQITDKIHDEKVASLVEELRRDLGIERDAKTAVDKKLAEAVASLAHLKAEKDGLETIRAQLEELVTSIREKLAKAEAAFGISEGEKATLEALLRALARKEESAQLEIHHLHGKLQDAKLNIEAIKEQVITAHAHAKTHWDTLQTIRVDGGWLRTDKKDVCDEVPLVLKPFCKLPDSKSVVAPTVTAVTETPSN